MGPLAGGFSGINEIDAAPSAHGTLIAAPGPNTWTIDGDDSGDVNGLLFADMANLVGGADADAFRIGSLSGSSGSVSGTITTGAGLNTLSIVAAGDFVITDTSFNYGCGCTTTTLSGTLASASFTSAGLGSFFDVRGWTGVNGVAALIRSQESTQSFTGNKSGRRVDQQHSRSAPDPDHAIHAFEHRWSRAHQHRYRAGIPTSMI